MQWQEFRSYIRHLSARDIARIERAFELGKKVHGDQKRKSGEPYFSHPVAVAHMLADMGADSDTLIAALLHDSVEDTPLTLEEIDRQFNGSVTALIDGVTKLCADDVASSPKLDEQTETLRKIFTLMQADVRMMVIKIVDRLHNMQTIEFLSPERQHALAIETHDIYAKIADKLCMQDIRDELEALSFSILEPDLFEKIVKLREDNEQRGQVLIEQIQERLRSQDPVLASRMKLHFEYKRWEQLRAQLLTGKTVATGLSFITIVFVLDDIDHCYRTLGMLHRLWQREVLSFQDFINAPQQNGYQGLHTTIIAQDGTRIRCKMRTREMQEYARKGICTKCFDAKALGISSYLPWTKKISPLTEDTEGNSEDFWQTLQSDILGETILIHGPDDATVRVPKGSTALDAAFYLFHEDALKMSAIKVNGIEVPPETDLSNADSLDITLEPTETVNLEWLRHIHSGVAKATIHHALASQSTTKKIGIGKKALEQAFAERGKGVLEEFNEKTLSNTLASKNYGSFQDVCIAIAEGRITSAEVYDVIFSENKKHHAGERRVFAARFLMRKDRVEGMRKLLDISQKFNVRWKSIRMLPVPFTPDLRFSMRVEVDESELIEFKERLREAEARQIDIFPYNKDGFFLIGVVAVLWALHPVAAKWLIGEGINPTTILSLRMVAFGFCTSVLFGVWKLMVGQKYISIERSWRHAVLPALSSISLAAFTYEALLYLPPSVHLTILRCNTLLIPLAMFLRNRREKIFYTLSLASFATAFISLRIFTNVDLPLGIIFSLLTLCAYLLYSVTVEKTLHEQKIGLRYPELLFRTGVFLGMFGVALFPLISWNDLPSNSVLLVSLYTLFFVFIPHTCYYFILNQRQVRYVTDIFFLEAPIAIVAEAAILGIFLSYWVYAAMGVTLITLYALRRRRINRIG